VQLSLFAFPVKKKINYFSGRKNSTRGLSITAFRPDSSLVLSVPKRYSRNTSTYISLFADDTCMHATGLREGCVLNNCSATYRVRDVM
jgi:hypothetical protein